MSLARVDRSHRSTRRCAFAFTCALAGAAPHAIAQHEAHPTQPTTASDQAANSASDSHLGHAGHTGHDAQNESTTPNDPHAGHAMPSRDTQRGEPAAKEHAPSEQAPKAPIPTPTEADRTAAFPDLGAHAMHGDSTVMMLTVDRLEAWSRDGEHGQHWDLHGWVGGDLQRVWLRSEGEREGGTTISADIELLYGRSVTPWWDVVVGIRHDTAPGAAQDWAALGVQGMAPYKFEVEATTYLGRDGRSAARLEASYDVLLTNRLILQPVVELEFHDRRDLGRDTGAGLSKIEAGLRLRYEFTRRFAPYLGAVHERVETADGHEDRETRLVGGVRLWF